MGLFRFRGRLISSDDDDGGQHADSDNRSLGDRSRDVRGDHLSRGHAMKYAAELETMLHECTDPVEHERSELILKAVAELAELIAATDDTAGTLSMVWFALRDRVRELRR